MKCYPAYKDSGIEWLGNIPKEWSLKKLKYISRVNSLSLSETTKEDYEFNYIDIGNVDIEKGFNLGEKIRFETAPSRARRIVRKGNTIVSTVRTYLKAIAYIGNDVEDVVVSTGFAVINPNKEIEPKFLYYLLRNEKFIDRICALSVGVSYPAINSSELSSIDAWFPNKNDQNKISAYLDRKAESIEKLIVKKERMIELLTEERAAIINQAVTKGINPKVEMKDSGIEWIGKIPAHWELKDLKYLLKSNKGALKTGPFGSQLKQIDMQGDFIKVYNQRSVLDEDFDQGDLFVSEGKFQELQEFEIFPEDMLISTRGTIGRCAIFPHSKDRGILHPCLIRVQFDQKKISNQYAKLYMQRSSLFIESVKYNSNATTIDVIYGGTLRDVVFVVPPMDEQATILSYLEKRVAQIDGQIFREGRSIELLKEYRTSLISEVVTGKIDVRG